MNMVQCELKKGNKRQVAWIEERGAKVGNNVELKTDNHEIWEVVSTGSKMKKEDLDKINKFHRTHREGSDI